jgi:hypothetical protein
LLRSLGGTIKKPPHTVADVIAEVRKIVTEADRLARELHAIKTDDH